MRPRLPVLAVFTLLVLLPAAFSPCRAGTEAVPSAKVAHGSEGMVAASTPYAAAAGARMLEEGGNAADAAAAAAFALMVTDPPMTSLGGRVQILLALKDGRVLGIDGATWTPGEIPPQAGEGGEQDERRGRQLAPVPGNPAALAQLVEGYGKLSLAQVLEPAIELAEEGFAVTHRVAAIWEQQREKLANDPGAATNYLKQDGSPYKEGEIFRHPRLAQVLRALAESGPEVFYRGWIADAIVRDMETHGGLIRQADLQAYQPQSAVTNRIEYGDYEMVIPARHARGSTLAEMVRTLRHFSLQLDEPTPEEAEIVVRIIAEVFSDRPSILEPNAAGGPRPDLAAAEEFARQRAARVRAAVGKPLSAPSSAVLDRQEEGVSETTHLSVLDAEGNAVALTTSIGPVFGIGMAASELGFLYAHSYRLDTRPLPHQRDYTEMTPTILLQRGQPVLAVGAAGSARIPGAILQVLSNVIDRGYSLEEAVAAPRVFCRDNKLQAHDDLPLALLERLRQRGFEIELIARDAERHLGRVHAVRYHPATGTFVGVADPAYDGVAAGPQSERTSTSGHN